MTPAELAALHPRLFHVTDPDAWPSIRERGLLSAEALTALFELPPCRREALLGGRRAGGVTIAHPRHGRAVLNDNLPLSLDALAACLDDGLSPADWLRHLNARVFFWVDRERVARLLGARTNRHRPRLVLELDTASVASGHAEALCLSPINSGSTIRKAARRGLGTHTPLGRHSHADWRRLRGGRDRVVEVTVTGAVPDVERHLRDAWRSDGVPIRR